MIDGVLREIRGENVGFERERVVASAIFFNPKKI